jgi:hypothetical protein
MSPGAEIPLGNVELYRAVARAYRNARRRGAHPKEREWAAIATVRQMRPALSRKEAEALAVQIVRTVSLAYPRWFWG